MDFSEIKGQESPKRAALIAIAGSHSITFYGPSGCGKTMLAHAMSGCGFNGEINEILPCPCGSLTDPRRACSCTADEIKIHLRQYRAAFAADIHCECAAVPVSYLFDKRLGTDSAQIRDRAARAATIKPIANPLCSLEKDGEKLFKQAYSELGLSMHSAAKIARVADTIRRLDGAFEIGAVHVAEAIQYRALDRCFIGSAK